jgi:hypothetical protein
MIPTGEKWNEQRQQAAPHPWEGGRNFLIPRSPLLPSGADADAGTEPQTGTR